MASLIAIRLREVIDDPEIGVTNDFLREVLAHIQRLESLVDDDAE